MMFLKVWNIHAWPVLTVMLPRCEATRATMASLVHHASKQAANVSMHYIIQPYHLT
jgi:hypothetical protein